MSAWMSPMVAKIAWVVMAVGWYGLRIPHVRRSRKTPVMVDAMDASERLRLAISLTGLGILPFVYVVFGEPAFARRAFHPALASVGAAGGTNGL